MRRDAKICMIQAKQIPNCSQNELLSIPLLGKAVFIYNKMYCLCSFCGNFLQYSERNRYRDEICCLSCDASMVKLKKQIEEKERNTQWDCRFCGKQMRPSNHHCSITRPVRNPTNNFLLINMYSMRNYGELARKCSQIKKIRFHHPLTPTEIMQSCHPL